MRATLLLLLGACAPDGEPVSSEPSADGAIDTEASGSVDTGPADTHPCGQEPLSMAIGTGITEYLPLQANDVVMMVDGPQTGWHVDVAGLLSGAPELVAVDAVVTAADGTTWFGDQASTRLALAGWDDGSCEGTFYGFRSMSVPELDIATVCALAGQPATMEVTVTDLLSGEETPFIERIDVVFGLDPKDAPYCD